MSHPSVCVSASSDARRSALVRSRADPVREAAPLLAILSIWAVSVAITRLIAVKSDGIRRFA
jgi:hypothetical protein